MIYVGDMLSRYDADALRYYLAVAGPENQDTDFTWSEFLRRNNDELVAGWGNLVNRTISMTAKNLGSIPAPDQRIQFSGSELVWEYYPGQGLQLQVLGTFGHALVDMPSERRIQPPSQDGRHFPVPPDAPWPQPSSFDDVAGITNVGINRHQSNPKGSLEPGVGSLSEATLASVGR